jgi:hypothetical protein
MRGRVLAVLAVLALVVAGGLALAYFALPRLIAGAVERIGSDVTDTPVEVGSARFQLREAVTTLRALSVGNPPGFAKRAAMEVGSLEVDPALRALLRGRGEIDRLAVGSSVVHVEVRADEGVNVLELRDRIAASKRAGEAGPDDAEAGDVAAAEVAKRRIHVNTLSIAPVRVSVDASAVGLDEPVDLTVPGTTLRNVEGTPSDLARTVVLSILDRSVAAASEKVALDPNEGLGAALRRGARKLLEALPGG